MRRDKKAQPAAWEGLKIVHPNAAGLDIALSEIWAAVSPERTAEPVRMFGTFTPDLAALADWLKACGVDSVAMEATGVYWVRRESRIGDCFAWSSGQERSRLFYQSYP